MMLSRARGSVLVVSLVLMLLVFSLGASLVAVSAARCRAIARESRHAQALALAESAVVAAQAALLSGGPAASVSGSLATGEYSAQVTKSGGGQLVVRGAGRARPLLGEAMAAAVEVTLVRRGSTWSVAAWREVMP